MRALFVLALLATAARADLFTWTDEKGVTHFSSTAPTKTSPVKDLRRHKSASGGVAAAPMKNAPPSAAPKDGPPAAKAPSAKAPPLVELFTTSWCGQCENARKYLNERGVAYKESDIEKDEDAQTRYLSYGTRGVPLAVIDGKPVLGFSPDAYEKLLNPAP